MPDARFWQPAGQKDAGNFRRNVAGMPDLRVGTITKRRDFLALRHTPGAGTKGFLMLARCNPDNGPQDVRYGLTVTRKTGGAVARNRMRRRLRAVIREVFPRHALAGTDYVLIARPLLLTRPYGALLDDMEKALLKLASRHMRHERRGACR